MRRIFPALAAAIDGSDREAPAILAFYKRDLSLASGDGAAVKGTRACAPKAAGASRFLASKFAARGFCIASGLALGCDTAAHEGALSVPGGRTAAILGNGLESVYPQENERLAERILEGGGLLLSEYAPGTPATHFRLVARDRLQAAMSLAVVFVQTAPDSGSMHAAMASRHAGKPLYTVRFSDAATNALPGTKGNHDPAAQGFAQYITARRDPKEMEADLYAISQNIREKAPGGGAGRERRTFPVTAGKRAKKE